MSTPGGDERLLRGVLGPIAVPQDESGDGVELVDREAFKLRERLLIARHRSLHEIPLHRDSCWWRPIWPLSDHRWRSKGRRSRFAIRALVSGPELNAIQGATEDESRRWLNPFRALQLTQRTPGRAGSGSPPRTSGSGRAASRAARRVTSMCYLPWRAHQADSARGFDTSRDLPRSLPRRHDVIDDIPGVASDAADE